MIIWVQFTDDHLADPPRMDYLASTDHLMTIFHIGHLDKLLQWTALVLLPKDRLLRLP